MKRSLKILIIFTLVIVGWFFGIDNDMIDLKHRILIPFILLILLGLVSLTNILWRVKNLRDHPN